MCFSLTEQEEQATSNHLSAGLVSAGSDKRLSLPLSVNGETVQMQVDCGSDLTLLGEDQWVRLGRPSLKPSKPIRQAGGQQLSTRGSFEAKLKLDEKEVDMEIVVATRKRLNLLGLNAFDALNLWDVPFSRFQTLQQHNAIESPHLVRKGGG